MEHARKKRATRMDVGKYRGTDQKRLTKVPQASYNTGDNEKKKVPDYTLEKEGGGLHQQRKKQYHLQV